MDVYQLNQVYTTSSFIFAKLSEYSVIKVFTRCLPSLVAVAVVEVIRVVVIVAVLAVVIGVVVMYLKLYKRT